MLLLRMETLQEGADWLYESLAGIARLQSGPAAMLSKRQRFQRALSGDC
jgi:hypothetical protein